MRGLVVGVLVALSACGLLLASTSLWTRYQLSSTEAFVPLAERILAEPVVRSRISTELADTVIARPDVQQAINNGVALLPPPLQTFEPAVEHGVRELLGIGVTALLNSAAFFDLRQATLTSIHTQLVDGAAVTFTVGQAKAGIAAQERTGVAGVVLNAIPDDLGATVLTPQQAPRLYAAVDVFPALWPWCGLLAVLALVGALVVSRRRLATLLTWAITAGLFGLLLVFALTVGQGALLPGVAPADEEVATIVYRIITGSLVSWTLWLVALMAGIAVLTLLILRRRSLSTS